MQLTKQLKLQQELQYFKKQGRVTLIHAYVKNQGLQIKHYV